MKIFSLNLIDKVIRNEIKSTMLEIIKEINLANVASIYLDFTVKSLINEISN